MLSLKVQVTGGLLTEPDIAALFDREISAELVELGSIGQRHASCGS